MEKAQIAGDNQKDDGPTVAGRLRKRASNQG